jgi:hypothetical protein
MREDDVGPPSADTIKLNFIRCGRPVITGEGRKAAPDDAERAALSKTMFA